MTDINFESLGLQMTLDLSILGEKKTYCQDRRTDGFVSSGGFSAQETPGVWTICAVQGCHCVALGECCCCAHHLETVTDYLVVFWENLALKKRRIR